MLPDAPARAIYRTSPTDVGRRHGRPSFHNPATWAWLSSFAEAKARSQSDVRDHPAGARRGSRPSSCCSAAATCPDRSSRRPSYSPASPASQRFPTVMDEAPGALGIRRAEQEQAERAAGVRWLSRLSCGMLCTGTFHFLVTIALPRRPQASYDFVQLLGSHYHHLHLSRCCA